MIGSVPKSSSFEALLGPVVPTAGYGPNGSQELSRNVIEAISGSPSSSALLMANHGAECLGTDYDNAFSIAHALEDLSRARYRSLIRMSLAYGLILPTDEEIAEEDSLGSDLSRYYEISEDGKLKGEGVAVAAHRLLRVVVHCPPLADDVGVGDSEVGK